jgi:hypothetical protein
MIRALGTRLGVVLACFEIISIILILTLYLPWDFVWSNAWEIIIAAAIIDEWFMAMLHALLDIGNPIKN